MAKGSKERQLAIKPRASTLSCQSSATALRHPPTTTPLSHPYDLLEAIVWMKSMQLIVMHPVHMSNFWSRSKYGGVQWTGLLYGLKTHSNCI